VRTLLADGPPDQEVARLARRRRAKLVVIGTHGRTGLSRAFMGSVADRIVRTAACPVLTVR
jgi:nucleotide-binding universal stress UspA family protein